ncbi:MAG: hypothetical protein ACYC8T_29100 [Myxococcaceae bacterium]
MRNILRKLLPLVALVALSCGVAPASGGPCAASCDCKQSGKPLDCLGEWTCNLQKTCEYTCKGTCALGAPYTCRDGEDCNGSICSEKIGCK